MADRETTVALLFDDASLSAHLREALVAQGARIVYESDLRSFAPAELVGSSADVVVVDLDNPGDDDLDRLYDTVEAGHPRLVLNDADASRKLEGWDRARWARHLAAKLVGEGVLDPPRPEDARAIEPRVAAVAGVDAPLEERFDEATLDDLTIADSHGFPETPQPVSDTTAFGEVSAMADDVADELSFSTPLSEENGEGEGVTSSELAAELEALLADSGPLVEDDLESLPSAPLELTELATLDLSGFEVVEEAVDVAAAPEEPVRESGSSLSLASLDDEPSAGVQETMRSVEIESRATEYVPPPVPEWDLVDHDAVVVEPVPRPAPAEFGIETISAAEYLAHDVVDDGTHGLEAGFTLELVSMEEAVAPRTDGDFAHEMFLDGAPRAVRRVIALAGTHESEASIATFLAALPERVPGVLLVVAHHGDTEGFAARLGARVATDGVHATHGDRLVVPRGAHVQIRRDGSVGVRDDGSSANIGGPSIDGVLSTLAGGFGADALAIVFAGRGNDAVAGAQAVYDAGGRVWVETVPPETEAGHMVAGIREERVADYAGDASALARKLIEEFP
ncbi:chemotaxis protein CheB [Luteibacter sp. Lutesp34]|uniref:chemotaxis protein CheB n=1 Tax=Luteibacter sp. Lutesp34 TaxID=3243030 RepID=UPI0039B44B21